MPTSMTVVATSTSASPAANARITLHLLGRAQLAVHQQHPEVAQLAGRKALVLGGGGPSGQRL